MRRPLVVAALAVAALASAAHGQLQPVENPALFSAAARAEFEGEARNPGGSVLRHSLHAAAGALVGAGIGYFASQLVYSDWDKLNDSTFQNERLAYSASGAAVGTIAGVLIGRRPLSNQGTFGVTPVRRRSAGVETISRDEIADTGLATAFEVVQSLHPEWLVLRGDKHFHELGDLSGDQRRIVVTDGTPQLRAYLDRAELGEVDALRKIPAADLESISFLSPAEATFRLGAGHAHGAIIARTRGSER